METAPTQEKTNPILQQYSKLTLILFALGIFSVLVGILRLRTEINDDIPVGVDWEYSYFPAMHHFRDYTDHSDFAGLPNALLFLPHGLLSLEWGDAINLALNIIVPIAVIWKYNAGWKGILLVYTSPMFFDLARTNNVDWLPLIALLLPFKWGLPFLLAKPQVIGGAALVWWKQHGFSFKVLIPAIVVAIVSLLIWGIETPIEGMQSIDFSKVPWNFAPFPLFIPLGIYLLYKGYKTDDATIAAVGTPFLVPYFAPYSLIPLQTMLACKYKKEALYLNLGFWIYLIVEARRIASQ